MLTNVFLFILRLSLTGAVIAAVIIIVKKIIGKAFSARWHYMIWFLLLIKLLVPITFSSSLSLFNVFKDPANFSYFTSGNNFTAKIDNNVAVTALEQPMQVISDSKSQNVFEKSTSSPQKSTAWLDICAYLWISGVIVLLTAAGISYWRMFSHTKKVPDPDRRYIENLLQNSKIDLEIDKKIRIRYSNCSISPFTIGIFKPNIVIPDTLIGLLDKQKLDIILRHELIHIKRNDHITRVLSYILQAIHWFNPLIWISFRLMAKDCEVSCDSTVIKEFDENMRKNYAMLLIETAQMINASGNYVKAVAFGENSLKTRIGNITVFKKHSMISIILSVLIFAVLLPILMTGAIANNNILNEGFEEIQTIKISCKTSTSLINPNFNTYEYPGPSYYSLSVYNQNKELLYNVENIKAGTYFVKTLTMEEDEKECRMLYNAITEESKKKQPKNNESFEDTLYSLEITYKGGKADYLFSNDFKYNQINKVLKNGNFITVENTEVLPLIRNYSNEMLYNTYGNPSIISYYGEQDPESFGIKRPDNGKILSLDSTYGVNVYSKGTIDESDKTVQKKIEISQDGFPVVPKECIQKGNDGRQYIWVSYQDPGETSPRDIYWRLAEITTYKTDGQRAEISSQIMRFKSIYLPVLL